MSSKSDDREVFNVPERYKSEKETKFIGRQGIVCKAFDNKTKRNVAIKKLTMAFEDIDSAKRAYREIDCLQQTDHLNVIKLLSCYTPQENINEFSEIYLIMESMEGDLSKVIQTRHYDQQRISSFMYQMLCGVNYLHERKIIHRDLTPKNIGYRLGVVKILDLGFARRIQKNAAFTGYVTNRYYRAPEIILRIKYDQQADIFSLGCIFAELITTEVLFCGEGPLNQYNKIVGYLGSPDRKFINTIKNDSIKKYVEGLESYTPKKLEEIFPDSKFLPCEKFPEILTAANARKLISKMLVIDPKKRISAQAAIDYPYVNLWKKPEEVDNHAEPINFATTDLFDKDWKIDYWKQLIFDKIKSCQELC
uniref:Stress-activated protein kinase JNK n=1 Tax=Panagrolaimus sp. PS1159 TaxID=55785 RepID=A0AC35FE28_9BILA